MTRGHRMDLERVLRYWKPCGIQQKHTSLSVSSTSLGSRNVRRDPIIWLYVDQHLISSILEISHRGAQAGFPTASGGTGDTSIGSLSIWPIRVWRTHWWEIFIQNNDRKFCRN